MIDLIAELHQQDLMDEVRRLGDERRAPVRRRAGRFGIRIFGARPRKG
jgi:hypothetical protein